jgi:hypothetical protein
MSKFFKPYSISMEDFKLDFFAGENNTEGVEFYYYENGKEIGSGNFEAVHNVIKQRNGRYTIVTIDRDGETYDYTNINGNTILTISPHIVPHQKKSWWRGGSKSRKRSHKKRATRRKH